MSRPHVTRLEGPCKPKKTTKSWQLRLKITAELPKFDISFAEIANNSAYVSCKIRVRLMQSPRTFYAKSAYVLCETRVRFMRNPRAFYAKPACVLCETRVRFMRNPRVFYEKPACVLCETRELFMQNPRAFWAGPACFYTRESCEFQLI